MYILFLFCQQNSVDKLAFGNILVKSTKDMNSDFKDSYSSTQVLSPNKTLFNSMSNGSGSVPKMSPNGSGACPKMSPVKKEEVLETPKHVLYDPSKIKLGWRNPPPERAGMSNMGNTCYLNSSLQVSCLGVGNIGCVSYENQSTKMNIILFIFLMVNIFLCLPFFRYFKESSLNDEYICFTSLKTQNLSFDR